MTSLLQLPREVRQAIFTLVIRSPAQPPTCPSNSPQHRLYKWRNNGLWNFLPVNPALALLQVCKLVKKEVDYVVRRRPHSYHVDIMYVKDCGLWTTWLDAVPLPYRSRYVDKVHITLRIFEPTPDLDDRFRMSMPPYRPSPYAPPSPVQAAMDVLDALFRCGPGFATSSPGEARGRKQKCGINEPPYDYIVKDLVVDVVAPTDGAPHTSVLYQEDEWRSLSDYARYEDWLDFMFHDNPNLVPEQRIANFFKELLDRFARPSRNTLASCASIYEHVLDRISLQVNGVNLRVYDVGHLLKEMNLGTWHSTGGKLEFEEWKRWLRRRRVDWNAGCTLDPRRRARSVI